MISVNLIPDTIQAAQKQRRHLRWWGMLILAASVVLVVPLGIDWYQSARAAELHAQDEQLQSVLATTRAELRAQMAQANTTLLHLERAKALRSKRAWSAMFALISRCMPAGCWLTSFATDPPGPSLGAVGTITMAGRETDGEARTTVTIEAPRKLRLSGYATDAAEPHEFVANLKSTGAFSHVLLEGSRREPELDGYYSRFELVCEW